MVPLCRLWWHYRHDGGSPAVLYDVVSIMVFIIASWFPRGVAQELVPTPRSSIVWSSYGVGGHNLELWGHGFR
jgi:hypothetical protein